MKNSETHYGWISIFLHWITAVTIFSLFALGYTMVDLGYYDTWYKTAPALHKSIGITLFMVMLFRLLWRIRQIQPSHLKTHTPLERKAGKVVHNLLYLLVFLILISGYLISTADGRGIEIFGLLTIPSLGAFFNNQEDIAGVIHQILAYILVSLAILHGIAALKHHFIDKDSTLKRMLGQR